MALINSKGSIVLSGKAGEEFSRKMKHPDREVMEKRGKFIDEAHLHIYNYLYTQNYRYDSHRLSSPCLILLFTLSSILKNLAS